MLVTVNNLQMSVKKLREGSNQTWKLSQINLVQVILEAHDNDKSTRKRQQCKWISSLFQYLDSIDSSSGVYKWYLDQLTSDILQVVLMKIANVQEMIFIDKSNKWFHNRKFFQVVSHLYTWYQSYKMVVPQVILNLSSSETSSLTYKSSSLSSGWPMLWHRGRCPTNWYQGQKILHEVSQRLQVVSFQHIW